MAGGGRTSWLPQSHFWVSIMKQVNFSLFFVFIVDLKKRRNYLGLVGLIKIIVFFENLNQTTCIYNNIVMNYFGLNGVIKFLKRRKIFA